MENKIKRSAIGSGGISRRRTIPDGIIKSEQAELTTVYDVNPDVNITITKLYNAADTKS